MAGRIITIKIEGAFTDEGHVRLSEFVQQLEAVRAALKHTERLVSGSEEPSLYYRIVDLNHSSPTTVVIEAVPIKPQGDNGERTVKRFLTTVRMIKKRGRVPNDADLDALEAYKNLGAVLEKNVSSVSFLNEKRGADLDRSFRSKLDEIIGPDELAEGSISGTLEWLNLHNVNRFNIYPVIGPQKVVCDFTAQLRQKVKAGIDRHVRVYGQLRYKKRDNFPYAVNVSDLEILLPEEELPTLEELRGIAPDATGHISAEEFIESLRDENR